MKYGSWLTEGAYILVYALWFPYERKVLDSKVGVIWHIVSSTVKFFLLLGWK